MVYRHGPSLSPLPLKLHKHDMVLHSSSVQTDDGVALRPDVKKCFNFDTRRAQYRFGLGMFSFVVSDLALWFWRFRTLKVQRRVVGSLGSQDFVFLGGGGF